MPRRSINAAAVRSGRGLVERAACRRLAQLAANVPADEAIVELGAYCGRSTGWLALGSRGAHVFSVDPWDNIAPDAVSDEYAAVEPAYRNGKYVSGLQQWMAHTRDCGITGHMVTAMQTTSLGAAAEWPTTMKPGYQAIWPATVGLLFHDAVHSEEAVAADLAAWLPHLAESCVVALHDLGCPAYGVEAGAEQVLRSAGFDWGLRERLLWRKAPDRRGLLVVHRRPR